MSESQDLENLRNALVAALSSNPANMIRKLVEEAISKSIIDAEEILLCPICSKQMLRSSRQPLSATLVKCVDCKYEAAQYSGVCRTTRINRTLSGGSQITIRSYDLDSTERAISLSLYSQMRIELKSKDKFFLLVAKPGLSEKKSLSLLINRTIGKTNNLFYLINNEAVFDQLKKTS